MNPGINSRGFWKIDELKEIIISFNKQGTIIPFVAIVESWLKPHMSDAQVTIPNYNLFHADKELSENGGSLLYILDAIPIDESKSYDDNICSSVICLSRKWKCIIASLYRPPSATKNSFENVLRFVNTFLMTHNENNQYKTFTFGDFNFPEVSWENGHNLSSPNKSFPLLAAL